MLRTCCKDLCSPALPFHQRYCSSPHSFLHPTWTCCNESSEACELYLHVFFSRIGIKEDIQVSLVNKQNMKQCITCAFSKSEFSHWFASSPNPKGRRVYCNIPILFWATRGALWLIDGFHQPCLVPSCASRFWLPKTVSANGQTWICCRFSLAVDTPWRHCYSHCYY